MPDTPQDTPQNPLTNKQEKALAALLSCPTLEAAAKAAGCSVATLHRWLQEDAFKDAYRAARREVVSFAVVQLQRASVEAVQTLRDVAQDIVATPGARVSAAKTILDLSLKAVELEDVVARVEQLEAHQSALEAMNEAAHKGRR